MSDATSPAGSAPLAPEIALALEEYRTVRDEELVALNSQITTLRYGVTGCVLLIGFAAQQHADRYLGWVVALALVPLVVLFSAVIWMGEYERVARAGHYIARLEARINAKLEGEGWPLAWEGWLREGGNAHSRLVGGHHRYLAITGVFLGFQIAAVVMGLHFYTHGHSHDSARHWLIPLAVAINAAILLTLLGYFRSSYDRLRGYTAELGPRNVRRRVRVRLKLYSVLAVVAFVSTPFFVWGLGALTWLGLHQLSWGTHVPLYWIALPTVLWMGIVPLLPSRDLMREIFESRLVPDETLDEETRASLDSSGSLAQLTDWERGLLHVVDSKEINAPSIGRDKRITVTTAALEERDSFRGALAHEIGHHRMHHLRPLALSYIYLWPYLYFDNRFSRYLRKEKEPGLAKALRSLRRLAFTFLCLPGWAAWVILRVGWRTAEYDADRFACASEAGEALAHALDRHRHLWEKRRPKDWRAYLKKGRDRLKDGRSLGYLPVPNEHPTPKRRLERLEELLLARRAAGAGMPTSTVLAAAQAEAGPE